MSSSRLIKTSDKEAADNLKSSGFNYMLEKINNKEVYVFVYTGKLDSFMKKNKIFERSNFYSDKYLRF